MKRITAEILIFFIKCYQWIVSPLVAPSCRYTPSCSQYSIDAVRRYGAFKGGKLTLKRILSCHPWGKSGYDPVC